MYAVYLGRALQTVNPPNASVGTAQLADSSVTSAKLASGAVANTPAFEATINTEQNPTNDTFVKINFDTEVFDTASAYDTSNKRFTVPSGQAGKYFIFSYACMGSNTNSTLEETFLSIYKNGSQTKTAMTSTTNNPTRYCNMVITNVMDLSVGDYLEMYGKIVKTSGTTEVRTVESVFGGYKIIE